MLVCEGKRMKEWQWSYSASRLKSFKERRRTIDGGVMKGADI